MIRIYALLLVAAACVACSGRPGSTQHVAPSRDAAAHRVGFVQHHGARIHYLEWPRSGAAIVLLPGYSLTGHAFDEVAAELADRYRVVAITPRGFGESDAPDSSAYTVATLADDLGAVLDSLRIRRPILVGHSLGGSVIARFALEHPDRVERLIFLDAFPYFASEGADSVDARNPIAAPAFAGDTTHDAIAAYLAKHWYVPWPPSLDADLRAKPLGRENERRRTLTLNYIQDQRTSPPDLARLTVPSLQLCAVASAASEFPWLAPGSPEFARATRYVEEVLRPYQRKLCDRFARTVPGGRVELIQGSHYVFFTQPALTVRAIRRYLE